MYLVFRDSLILLRKSGGDSSYSTVPSRANLLTVRNCVELLLLLLLLDAEAANEFWIAELHLTAADSQTTDETGILGPINLSEYRNREKVAKQWSCWV